ncbi:uncharacterized protein MYCGRDRAFT_73661 [Zymoseptoria tritici IPO323]|uniref:Thioesterase/thiol ester dehydrase-isomerase n=1 Tax=Zymoseptoria tritici (strain CBS 115943 / IPO323) TaxID=336722 RepID=F9XGH9_ZYMTI|nr:uncharacterized protein MYCGRDRAFT_73661 [Zymoseptoria tritici IPO323]EGP85564.1 hypothetical protein MYCGRDRAFT_73661 [Zymoseptoria tritici IPO323]
MPASNIAEQNAVDRLSENVYASTSPPILLGNAANIAYGGCALGVGVNAAYQTVKPGYHIYSVLGHYLGPTLCNRKIFCKITRTRDTRTFATRLVEVSQKLDNGTIRGTVTFLADFQVQEPATLLDFTSIPEGASHSPEECATPKDKAERLLREGKATAKIVAIYDDSFKAADQFLEIRSPPSSMMSETLAGLVKGPTSQDKLSLTSKTTSQWVRSRHPLERESDHLGALAFYMDGALSFLPLTHSKMSLFEAGACSSLDFALRIMSNEVDMVEWNFKEMKVIHGSDGRTYSEGRLFNKEGKMIAVMTQQSILRPQPAKKASL